MDSTLPHVPNASKAHSRVVPRITFRPAPNKTLVTSVLTAEVPTAHAKPFTYIAQEDFY